MPLVRFLTSALFAGAATGLITALLQIMFVQPVLLHAELYESGQLVHFGAEAVSANPDLPLFDAVRDGMTILFTALTYTGYAMILIGLMSIAEQRGHMITVRNGLLWGVAGFITFQFAPGISLPPELPGSAAADVGLRQIWWVATSASTGIALWLLAFGGRAASYAIAVALLVASHVIGPPEPDTFTGPVPPEIAAHFVGRAFGVGIAAWAMLGTLAAYFWKSEASTHNITA